MGSDLAQIYARVVAVRPDLAVTKLLDVPVHLRYEGNIWFWYGPDDRPIMPCGIVEASALITVKWLGALPRHANVQKGETAEGTIWEVWMPGQEEDAGWNTNLLHALAEFHAPGSTKGPNDER